MRKSIDGLAAIVVTRFALDPFEGCWFVFCNKGRDKMKILHWDTNGFWLYYRRLERGRFQWPRESGSGPLIITSRQLQWLSQHNVNRPLPGRQRDSAELPCLSSFLSRSGLYRLSRYPAQREYLPQQGSQS